MTRRRATQIPEGWTTELLVCPDDACERIQPAGKTKGRPHCAGPLHKKIGIYPAMDRITVRLVGRPD